MVPVKLVHLSYFVSSVYVVSHSIARSSAVKNQLGRESGRQQHQLKLQVTRHTDSKQPEDGASKELGIHSPYKAFVDTIIWQGLASVIIPGFVINRTCALSRLLLHQFLRRKLSPDVRKWTVTGIGLGSIPFIISPIDR